MKRILCAALLAACALSQAQLIVGNDQSGAASLYYVDVATGQSTALFSTSTTSQKFWGLAADNVNQVLYWNSGSTLNWASFASVRAGAPIINSIGLTFNGSASAKVALAFDEATGKLMATKNIATEAVYEVNPATGVTTQLYAYSNTLDFGGLEVDNTNGKLYGLSDSPSTARGLYEINIAAQTTTLKAPYPAGETDIDGLAVNNGLAYYVTDGPNTTQQFLYIYDVNTGNQVGTFNSPFTGSGTFSAGTWAPGLNPVPEPGTMIALGLGAGWLLRRRKR
jgi:hypothetical protein